MKIPLLQPHFFKKAQSPRSIDERIQKEALRLKAVKERLRLRESQLKEREKYTEQKEQFLNKKKMSYLTAKSANYTV